ncbi:hypothetical protein Pcinc_043632 [Petrolisthes cinctipes]|uniref:Uncharacterized protein n=1 Tax=Petrolisthes cinctipes TaxID=88211 RepID=A0AAE1BID8_PETCI|nr:hypothetical protein Pcinc_043632 [Petrolisthes cinctipes]
MPYLRHESRIGYYRYGIPRQSPEPCGDLPKLSSSVVVSLVDLIRYNCCMRNHLSELLMRNKERPKSHPFLGLPAPPPVLLRLHGL